MMDSVALILVADDEPAILEMIKAVLETRGHQVATAVDGVELIEQAKTLKPKLIIADVMMPGAYGSAAYKALQEDTFTKNIPILFMTAITPAQADKVIPKSPLVRVLHKPMDATVILKAVDDFLAK